MERADLVVSSAGVYFIWPSNIAGRWGQVWSSWGFRRNEVVFMMDSAVDRFFLFFRRIILRFTDCG